MRSLLLLPALALVVGCAVALAAPDDRLADEPDWMDGDLVFHASQSEQSRWIALATGSRLTHVGLVDVRRDGVYVVEAVQPVKVTPLEAFRGRYGDRRVAVKRAPGLTDAQRGAVVKAARAWVGRDYDARFDWSDTTLYCSELVWKAYANAVGLRIAPLGTFGDFALLDTPIGASFVARRWGPGGPDRDAPVVSPADLWNAEATVVVADQL